MAIVKKFSRFSWNLRGRLVEFDRPAVMGIVNVTDDSFYAPSRVSGECLANRVGEMIAQGADIIDLGACSTRPGSEPVDAETESRKVVEALRVIRSVDAAIPLSVDTFRASVAQKALEAGADIVNDVSMAADPDMIRLVSEAHVPYVLTHNAPRAERPEDVTAEGIAELSAKVAELALAGVADVVIDPGVGFGKSLDENYALIRDLEALRCFSLPILVGVSRKSMIRQLLGVSAEQSLNATTSLHTIAIAKGASILRVHDVAEARQVIDICQKVNTL